MGRLDVTITAWERAHAQSVRAGDRLAAAGAAVRVALHLLLDTALMAPVRGGHSARSASWPAWRATSETPVHAWLAVVRSYERLLSGDFPSARRWARRAIEVGARCDPAAAAVGRVAEARSLILEGEVRQGLGLLNEAAVATVSGELDPLSTGLVYCELVCALQGLAQYDLAEEWTAAMERWRHGQPVGSVHGRCRVHRAEILRLRGALREAEQEALGACEELRPYLRRELGWPLTELGRIRLRRGDIRGADEAFRAAHEAGWDPQPGPALVQLARGDVALAAASIGDALAHPPNVPSKELPPHTALRRAPLLEAQVEIEVAAGHLDRARAAADELARIAAQFESEALAASAAHARGRVGLAEGDAAGARRAFEAAAHRWDDVGAPYETALARMGLAHAYRAEGNEARAVLEFRAARSGFERVGAVDRRPPPPGRAATREAGRTAAERERPPPARPAPDARGAEADVFRREGDYWSVAFEGQTVRLRDLKGLRYLARLLAAPGREVHVLDLVAAERGGPVRPRRALGAAWRSLRPGRRRAARRAGQGVVPPAARRDRGGQRGGAGHGDAERDAQAGAERDFLVRELSRAVGLGGRDRRAGSASERARASVTRAVRQAWRASGRTPAAGRAPRPRRAHRDLLRLPARPAGAGGLDYSSTRRISSRASSSPRVR